MRQTIIVPIAIDKAMNRIGIPITIAIGCVDQREYSLFIVLYFIITEKKRKNFPKVLDLLVFSSFLE